MKMFLQLILVVWMFIGSGCSSTSDKQSLVDRSPIRIPDLIAPTREAALEPAFYEELSELERGYIDQGLKYKALLKQFERVQFKYERYSTKILKLATRVEKQVSGAGNIRSKADAQRLFSQAGKYKREFSRFRQAAERYDQLTRKLVRAGEAFDEAALKINAEIPRQRILELYARLDLPDVD